MGRGCAQLESAHRPSLALGTLKRAPGATGGRVQGSKFKVQGSRGWVSGSEGRTFAVCRACTGRKFNPADKGVAQANMTGDSPYSSMVPTAPPVQVSLVMTVRNEGESIGRLMRSILAGSVRPAEIVIADGGSTDNTQAIVQA